MFVWVCLVYGCYSHRYCVSLSVDHVSLNCVKFWVQITVGCCLIVKPAALQGTAVWG